MQNLKLLCCGFKEGKYSINIMRLTIPGRKDFKTPVRCTFCNLSFLKAHKKRRSSWHHMQSQTKTGPKPQKLRQRNTKLYLCLSVLPPQGGGGAAAASTTSLHHLCPPAGDSECEQLCWARSSSGWPRVEIADTFLCASPPFASCCVSWSCIWVYGCRPGRFSPSATERLRCITPAGLGPGRISGGKQKIFQRKAPTNSLLGRKPGSDLHLRS